MYEDGGNQGIYGGTSFDRPSPAQKYSHFDLQKIWLLDLVISLSLMGSSRGQRKARAIASKLSSTVCTSPRLFGRIPRMLGVPSPLAPLVPSFRKRSECVPFYLIPSVDLTRGCHTGFSAPSVYVPSDRNFFRPIRVGHPSQFHQRGELTQIHFVQRKCSSVRPKVSVLYHVRTYQLCAGEYTDILPTIICVPAREGTGPK